MIALSDKQLLALMEAVRPLSPAKRILFVARVAAMWPLQPEPPPLARDANFAGEAGP
jgi:hypothetical protein